MFDKQIVDENLRRHVHYLSVIIGERHLWKNNSLGRAAEYIDSVSEENKLAAKHQTFSCYGKTVSNIIVEKPGRKSDLVILGAHHDTVPGSPGADDNASSVAVLLEIARLSKEIQNEKTFVFAAFVNEESPCCGTPNMGSMVYAKSLKKFKVPVEVMICLESIGYFSKDESQQYPFPGMRLFYPRAADFLGVVGNLRSIRNKNYHLETDTIDTLDFNSMTQIVKGLYHTFKKF